MMIRHNVINLNHLLTFLCARHPVRRSLFFISGAKIFVFIFIFVLSLRQ
jgi:hypothetical protein